MVLVNAAGAQIAKAPGGSVLESVTETDPKIKVLVPVYNVSAPEGTVYPPQRTQLAFREGQVIRQSAWNAYFAAATIGAVSPATGSAAGGTAIVITGTNFSPSTTVTVGGASATSVVVVSPGKITAVTPVGTAGTRDVVVTTPAGSVTKTGGFTYTA